MFVARIILSPLFKHPCSNHIYSIAITFLSHWAAFRNLLMKTYGVGTDKLNCKVFIISFSCRNWAACKVSNMNQGKRRKCSHNNCRPSTKIVQMGTNRIALPSPKLGLLCMLCLKSELGLPPQEQRLPHTCMLKAWQSRQPTGASSLQLFGILRICLWDSQSRIRSHPSIQTCSAPVNHQYPLHTALLMSQSETIFCRLYKSCAPYKLHTSINQSIKIALIFSLISVCWSI